MPKKAFRLFISSTFKDFTEERELLRDPVFRELESYCAARGFDFRAVDMRWGVNEHAQLDQRTAEICLDEVREAKSYPAPSFLILIGDRYGWVTLPFAIARDELEAARDWLLAQGQEGEVAELDRVYERDDNYVIAVGLRPQSGRTVACTLRSREDDLADLADPEAWSAVETRLRKALQGAAGHLHSIGRLDDAGRDKYFFSLTELEIRTALAGEGSDAAARTIAWIRTTAYGEPQVRALAASVRAALPVENVVQGGRDDFTSAVTTKLKAAIDRHIEAVEALTRVPDFGLHEERALHQAFAAERLKVFVGRDANRAAIAAYLAGTARHPLVLTGISGTGKSALMARAAADADHLAAVKVARRFVGASAASADQRALLVSLVEDLAALGAAEKPARWEDDANRFVAQVREVLAAIDEPVAIFIDALDQIRAPYRSAWLPDEFRPNVKVVVSALDDGMFATEREIVQGLRRRLPPEAFLEIGPLSARDGQDILAGLEHQAGRSLQPGQRDFLLERFRAAGASPLYLVIAFAIARRWRSTTDPRIGGLAGDVTALIGQFLDELSSVHHHESLLVERVLGLLAAGKDGLSESELIAILSRDEAVMQAISSERFGARTVRLPDSVWARLRRSLSALLVEKGIGGEPLLSFFHRQVAKVAQERFYLPAKAGLHQKLAAYFDHPLSTEQTAHADKRYSRRSLSELPYQLFHGGRRARLDGILSDPAWIDRKIESFAGVAEIIDDYESFANPDQRLHHLIGRTLRLASGIIGRDPSQRMSQLHGRLIGAGLGDEHEAFIAGVLARAPGAGFVETLPAQAPPGAEIARLEGHTDGVGSLALLGDGRLASGGVSGVKIWDPASGRELAHFDFDTALICALALAPDGRLIGADSQTLRIWDPSSGRELDRLNAGRVNALAITRDSRIVTGTQNGAIELWDLAERRAVHRIDAHKGWVHALAPLHDGRLASCGELSGVIWIWTLEGEAPPSQIQAHRTRVNALLVLGDGRLVSGSDDRTIAIWDAASGQELARLKGPSDEVKCLAALSGERLASADGPHVRIWDLNSGREIARYDGHTDKVEALAVLSEGRLASCGRDRTVRIWDISGGHSLARLPEGHEGEINALAQLRDGRVASGADDKTIRLWDQHTGRELARFQGHSGDVTALAALGGDCLVSAARSDDDVRIWDVATGHARVLKDEGMSSVLGLMTLPDGRFISGGYDNIIRIWNPHARNAPLKLVGQGRDGHAFALLPGNRLACGGEDETIRIRDLKTGRELQRFAGHRNPTPVVRGASTIVPSGGVHVYALASLGDGLLASCAPEASIRIWDTNTGAELARLEGHEDWVDLIAALPDGRLVSGSWDRTIRLWDTRARREISRFEFDGAPGAILVLADGRVVAGDKLGRLHWLAIKGEASRATTPSPPPHHAGAVLTSSPTRTPHRRGASLSHAANPAKSSPSTRGADTNRRANVWAGLLALIMVLIAAFAAAALWGPQFGFRAAHEALNALLAVISKL